MRRKGWSPDNCNFPFSPSPSSSSYLRPNVSPQNATLLENHEPCTNSGPQVVLAQLGVVVDLKKPYRARVVLWPGILRSPVDELGAKATVAADIEVIEMLLELGDVVYGGRDGSITGGIVLLEELAVDGGVTGPITRRMTVGDRIAFVVEVLGTNTVIPIDVWNDI